jgi:hypothetical protein
MGAVTGSKDGKRQIAAVKCPYIAPPPPILMHGYLLTHEGKIKLPLSWDQIETACRVYYDPSISFQL